MRKPIYVRIKQQIQKEIENKKANDVIESERLLSKRLGASRMTVRKSLDELVEEGYLYRKENVGTFVADRSLRKRNTSLLSDNDANLEYRLINFDVKYGMKNKILEKLNLTDQDSFSIIRAIRLVLKNDKPQQVEEFYMIRNYINEKHINQFDKLLDLSQYLKKGRMTQRFIPTKVPPKYAASLKVTMDEPILMIEGRIFDNQGTPFIYYRSYNNPREKTVEITI